MKPIYLDYNATTPLAPEVAAAMEDCLRLHYGNPSSSHVYGVETRQLVEEARRQVAELLGAAPGEIIFTSGGTESNNMAIIGAVRALPTRGGHIVTTAVEHPAVTEVCRYLEREGYRVTWVPVDSLGRVDPDDVRRSIAPDTVLISVMHANNEVGTIQPVAAIGAIAREHGIPFHTDAAQSVGKVLVRVDELNVDLLSVAGHKLYAPKGVGALYVRQGVRLGNVLFGAGQEQGRRPGTENTIHIVGLGRACALAAAELPRREARLRETRDLLWNILREGIADIRRNGDPDHCLPNTLSAGVGGVMVSALLAELSDVAASAGAACHENTGEPSDTLKAMQVPLHYALGTLRLSTGRSTTEEEVRLAGARIVEVAARLQSRSGGSAASAPETVRLTQYTAGLGCACKLRPQLLEEILRRFQVPPSGDLLVGTDSADDASVYRLTDDLALVVTVDFFTPIVDDPFNFGMIAAANSLSDVYAMGGRPLLALNIVGFPSHRLPVRVLETILEGAARKVAEAGVSIVGGHTVDDPEPKFGLAVVGLVDPRRVVRNSTAVPGDTLVLTKPLGTGIISTALKRGVVAPEAEAAMIRSMARLNAAAARAMEQTGVSAATDVTGFGLLGHLLEMTRSSGVEAEVVAGQVPLLPEAERLAALGMIPGGTVANREYVEPHVDWAAGVRESQRALLCDAQTSGGLLMAVPSEKADRLMEALAYEGVAEARPIGRITGKGNGRIRVV